MGAVFEVDMPALFSPGLPMSVSSVRSVVRRWEKLGVARAEPMIAHQGRLVRLTAEGAILVTDCDEDAYVATHEGFTVAVHRALVSRARLRIEGSAMAAGPVDGWMSERAWRLENAGAVSSGDYVPHGMVLLVDGDPGVVYVAHTAAELVRFRLRLAEICRRHPFVVVVARSDLLDAAITTQLGDLAVSTGGRLEFVDL
ncbi:hypothetical protein MXD61_14240 [Frankia sp. AgPm24]|uniref:hypothetical protein n=1 Tax=Frankia sp. AgPm24 TaxID=631128 RepID=UPI00201072C4|nr:hypothetical protein [Frankia sp. AgPm24]MCK9923015.1 hypothetical protein [Frankia sp. AgPm24]